MQQNWPETDVATIDPADLAACNRLLRAGSKSFHAASMLLPRQVREPATALYAFCRLADDAVDDGPGGPLAVSRLEQRVEAAYAGRPADHAADRAFAATVLSFAMPKAVPLALIEGFAWDAAGRRYDTFGDLCDYAARVAGCVGIMMTTVMERRSPDILSRAADLGVAMQLTNIARDVGEDARKGRLYLPLVWLREAGIDPDAFLDDPVFTPALRTVIARLLDEAAILYARADAGIEQLPVGCRAGIRAARLIYSEIDSAIVRNGHDSVSRRAVVGKRRKLVLLARALFAMTADRLQLALPPLASTHYLVTAVMSMPWYPSRLSRRAGNLPWWNLAGRTVAVIDIFERLGRVDRAVVRGP
jgi:15-cis-phytoene synthase